MGSAGGPVLQAQPINAGKLTRVVAHQRGLQSQGMAGDPQVIGTDRCASAFERVGMPGVMPIDLRSLGVEHRHQTSQLIKLTQLCQYLPRNSCFLGEPSDGKQSGRPELCR
jgi:hypothetical protein